MKTNKFRMTNSPRYSQNIKNNLNEEEVEKKTKKKQQSASAVSKLATFNCAKRVNHFQMELVFNLKLKCHFTWSAIKSTYTYTYKAREKEPRNGNANAS